MKKRTLQIDVLGPTEDDERIIECMLIIDGRSCTFYTSRANYQALIFDKVFLRDGKEKDSAGILNTTRVFDERVDKCSKKNCNEPSYEFGLCFKHHCISEEQTY